MPKKTDNNDDKKAKLRKFVNKMQSSSKKGLSSNVYLGSDIPKEDVVMTGYPFLDWFLGGGWRRGRHHLIYGPSSAGKTSLMLGSAREMINDGLIVQYNDVEDFLTKEYLQMLGIDPDMFVWSPEKSAVKILNTAREFAKENIIDVMVIDTIAAMSTPSDTEDPSEGVKTKYKKVGEQDVAKLASLLTDYFKKIAEYMRDSKLVAIYLNQIRSRGVGGSEDYDPMFFRDGVSINGGKAMIHNTALSLYMKRAAKSRLRGGSDSMFDSNNESTGEKLKTGFAVELAVRKSKLTSVREFTSIMMEYFYEGGFNDRTSLVEYMSSINALTGTSWQTFEYQGYVFKEQGMNNVRERIMEDDEAYGKMMDFLWDNRNDILNMSLVSEEVKEEMIEMSGVDENEGEGESSEDIE